MWWLSCQNGWILAYVAYQEGKRASDHRADLVEAASVAVSDTANVLCDRALLNTTPRSDCIAERQARRDILPVIRSRENFLGTFPGLQHAAIHAHAPNHISPCGARSAFAACDVTEAYGLFHGSLFAMMAQLSAIAAGFVREILGCTFLFLADEVLK